MPGTTLDFAKNCKIPFGAYVETHEENKPTNTMVERTCGAICLGPSANFQGSHKFLCLCTGRKIIRKQFREVPMPASVMKCAEAIALGDKRSGNMEFTDRNGIPITDDDETDDNPGDDLTEADTEGVNCPDLDNTDNPSCLLIEPEEIDDMTKATMTFLSYPRPSQTTSATKKSMISQIPRTPTPMGTRSQEWTQKISQEWTPRRSQEWTKMMMQIPTPKMSYPLSAPTSTSATMKTATMKRRSPRMRTTHPRYCTTPSQ
jgi:hypothetical protein